MNNGQQECQKCAFNTAKRPITFINDNSPDDNIIMWEYECGQCHSQFKVPVPSGPSEAKKIRCTKCGSMDITRINTDNLDIIFCGG